MESLVSAPMTNKEFLISKIISSGLPGYSAILISAVPFVIVTDFFTYQELGFILLPDTKFLLFIFLLLPLVTLVSVSLLVIISINAKDVKEAHQMGMIITLPMMAFISGMLIFALFDLNYMFYSLVALIFLLIISNIALDIFKKLSSVISNYKEF